jgi:hypothetical protein
MLGLGQISGAAALLVITEKNKAGENSPVISPPRAK